MRKVVKRETIRMQKRAPNGEGKPKPLGFRIHPELLFAIEKDAQKFNCSAAFVINTAIALTMGIDVGEKYYQPEDRKNGRRRKK
jgi:hypothetical protein